MPATNSQVYYIIRNLICTIIVVIGNFIRKKLELCGHINDMISEEAF